MTEDLEAIDVLSERFNREVKEAPRFDTWDTLLNVDPLVPKGEKVLRMYEAELEKAPDDQDVKESMATHCYRMGYMYYDSFHPGSLYGDYSDKERKTKEGQKVHQACNYLVRSHQLIPNAPAASILADIFRISKFYATAIFWYDEAIKYSSDTEYATKAKATKLDLKADGKTADPQLSRKIPFPTANTPGLIMANQQNVQPASNQLEASAPITNPTAISDSPAIQSGKKPDMGWVRNGGITAGVGILIGLVSHLGLFNIITLAGIVIVAIGFMKGKSE